MPCGGIYSINAHWSAAYLKHTNSDCFQCTKQVKAKRDLFVEEWDAYLHRKCLGAFLKSPEGEIVIKHGHEIIITAEGE
jgi:hypothetical protein